MNRLKMGAITEDWDMPIFEFTCPKGHGKFELITLEKFDTMMCPKCGEESEKVEWSVPAKRNPEHGLQK